MTRPQTLAGAFVIVALAIPSQAEPGNDIKPTIETLASREGRGLVSDLTGRAKFFSMVSHEAQRYGLPTALADAVVTVESGYDASAVGTVGEVGLMQVRPSTAAMLGFSGEPPGFLTRRPISGWVFATWRRLGSLPEATCAARS